MKLKRSGPAPGIPAIVSGITILSALYSLGGPELSAQTPPALEWEASSGERYAAERSPDLNSWSTYESFPKASGAIDWRPHWEDGPAFFRIRLLDLSGAGDVRDGLVLEYRFEEPDGEFAFDTSGQELHGILHGRPSFVQGYKGGGLFMDGINDYIVVGDDPRTDLRQFTITAWIRTNGRTTDPQRQEILEKSGVYWLNIRNVDGRARTGSIFRDEQDVRYWIYIDSDDVVPLNRWIHLAASYDGISLRLYLNGRLASEEFIDLPVRPDDPNTLLVIGGKQTYVDTPVDAFFSGALDDLRIYSRALSQDELIVVMHAP